MRSNSRRMASTSCPNLSSPSFTAAPRLQAEKPQGWMIASAVYRAALADDAAHVGHVVDRLTAEFEIRVFNAAARVRIPLRREEVSLEPGQAKLDDRSVQPEWEPDGSALLLEIAEPGKYRLELTLRPTVHPDSHLSAFDLAIPRVPTSRLEFTVPTGGPQVEFPSALGAVRWEEVQSRWTLELGPSDRLAAGWQDSAPAGSAAAVDVEQLLWLKIEPGCVLLDVRMKAKAICRATSPLARPGRFRVGTASLNRPRRAHRADSRPRRFVANLRDPMAAADRLGDDLRPAFPLAAAHRAWARSACRRSTSSTPGPCDDRWPFPSIPLWSIKCPGRGCRKPGPCPSSSTIGAAAIRPPSWPSASMTTPRSGAWSRGPGGPRLPATRMWHGASMLNPQQCNSTRN